MSKRVVVLALGGNGIQPSNSKGSYEDQFKNIDLTAKQIAGLIESRYKVVITHGNGPQVGAALLRSERAAGEVYTQPLDVCVASTQSEIGYLLQRAIEYELRQIGLFTPVMTVLTFGLCATHAMAS